ncbi:MAG: SLC13 family permease [Chloroflexota bacterium]
MTPDNILVLLILLGALILFVSEKLRVDVVAMVVLAALLLTGLVSVDEAFAGFSSPAVITVIAVFIISGALNYSGVADALARATLRIAGDSQVRLLLIIMIVAGIMSAFMNNIGAVAIMLPAVVSAGNSLKIPPSRLLLPLAFAALLGGNLTLIGTPPNILASSILESYPHIEPFGFFDFLPMGIIVLTAGILYMIFIGRHLLPDRRSVSAPSEAAQLRPYLTELLVTEPSPLVGKSVPQTDLGERYNLIVVHIQRQYGRMLPPTPNQIIQPGDIILVKGQPDDMMHATEMLHLVPVSAASESGSEDVGQDLTSSVGTLAEIALGPRSDLAGLTLEEVDFRKRYDLSVLAMRHDGESIVSRLGDVPLRFGDSLLVQGPADKIDMLRRDDDFLILDRPPTETRRLGKGRLAIVILIATLAVITFGWLEPAAGMFIGALLMILTGIVRIDEAYEAIEWKAVFLIACILPLGVAMETTGTAALIAHTIVGFVGDIGPMAVLLAVFLMTALLTEVISNAAATVLVVPIAIDTALHLGASPYAFVMAVVIAASTSFLLPIGHQVNVLVFGPGGYKVTDYTRVGIWLNILILILVAVFLPIFWPLFP